MRNLTWTSYLTEEVFRPASNARRYLVVKKSFKVSIKSTLESEKQLVRKNGQLTQQSSIHTSWHRIVRIGLHLGCHIGYTLASSSWAWSLLTWTTLRHIVAVVGEGI